MFRRSTFVALFPLLALAGRALPQESSSYAKDIRPFLVRYCVECHNAKNDKRGLVVETYKSLLEGSDLGPVIVAGKPDESKLILSLEKREKPHMPPKEAKRFPTKEEIAQVRAWVKAGAKDDGGLIKVVIPDIKPQRPTAGPVTGLAYHPRLGALLEARYKTFAFIHPDTGGLGASASSGEMPITALALDKGGTRFALGLGNPGTQADIQLFSTAAAAPTKPAHVLRGAHKDIILDLAFSAAGDRLASSSYDSLVKIWDVASAKEIRTLKEHSDSVYGVAFSPDGKLLASGGADRAVKVWEVATGKLLYTLGESTDWVYVVAFSPDGQHLAAAGVDKSIRVWQVTASEHKLMHSVFGHEAPVLKLVYAADGKTLYSLGEDRIVKAWDAARMVERRVYDRQPEAVLALAVSADQKQLALGRYDGVVVLLDEPSGKVVREIGKLEAKEQKVSPTAKKITPEAAPRGQTVVATVEGQGLDQVSEVALGQLNVTAKILARAPDTLKIEFTIPKTAAPNVYPVTLKAPGGSATVKFTVDAFRVVAETGANDSPGRAQPVSLPVSVAGALDRAGDVDFYRFTVQGGQQLGAQILTKEVGSKVEPVLTLLDAQGNVLMQSDNGLLGYTFAKGGAYVVGVRDRELRGGPGMSYRLHLGELPVVTSVFPLGLERGAAADIRVQGVFLDSSTAHVKAPADAAIGSRIPVPAASKLGVPLGLKSVVVGEFPEVRPPGAWTAYPGLSNPDAKRIPLPGTANGEIDAAGKSDVWSFQAKKGQRLIAEVNARRLGSNLDSVIEILDGENHPVPRATLRCLAKTNVTFRDHDSAGANIRIEAWGELAVNDYIYLGNELLKIESLPTHPDADCIFFSDRGQRIGFLDTTPTHVSNGLPMYKVAIHPPGTKFPPNGFPVITLYYRNDDGGPGYGRDSRIVFDPPADGHYRVRIGDARGQGGENYGYRLTVRPPRPSFNVSFSPTAPAVSKGGAIAITATAERIDGYEGPIALGLENLPPDITAPATAILAGENSTAFALFADAGATIPKEAPKLKLVAKAVIDGRKIVKEIAGERVKLVEPGEIITSTEESEVTLRPGGTVKLTVNIERRKGFTGRVPVEVRGLPHGVKVLDIGLNGILITERETSRTMVFYAEAWVEPTEHPIVVLARREGKNSEHAAKSVLLRIAR